MARAGAVLLPYIGIPCRILTLADLSRTYNGHVVAEGFYQGTYGVIDFIHGYLFYDKTPFSVYELWMDKSRLDAYSLSYRDLYSAVGISEYDSTDKSNVYRISGPNAYYLKLIYTDHHDQWIMGENGLMKN